MDTQRVIVAMSGGVDSSVAALLLSQEGYDVVGVTMRLWSTERSEVPEHSKRCCSVEDVDDARRVCQKIGVPHYVLNFEKEFQEHVVDYFCREYDEGRTPLPCLACNDKIKFDFLLQRAMFLEADYIATGHYARINRTPQEIMLLKGIDSNKDQSYMLFNLGQNELESLLLPVGSYSKKQIRSLAADYDLPVADKPDSQDICFIPHGDYRKFLSERTRLKTGDITDTTGAVLGKHNGIQLYTIGQRRKLGLSSNIGEPMYVIHIDSQTNKVTLGNESDLLKTDLWASSVNYISGIEPTGSSLITAKIRYKSSESPATLTPMGMNAKLHFDQPQKAVTPGQAVVFYDGDKVIGGGMIEIDKPIPGSGSVEERSMKTPFGKTHQLT